MKKSMITLLVAGMLMVQGCGTIMCGSTQDVAITSVPPGATVTAQNGVLVITPGVLTLKRKDIHVLTATFPGYTAQAKVLERKLNGWLWADFFWDFGIITGSIDFATGAAYKISPNVVNFKFTKEVSRGW